LHYSSAKQQAAKLFSPLFIILNITKAQFAFIVHTKDFIIIIIIFSLTHTQMACLFEIPATLNYEKTHQALMSFAIKLCVSHHKVNRILSEALFYFQYYYPFYTIHIHLHRRHFLFSFFKKEKVEKNCWSALQLMWFVASFRFVSSIENFPPVKNVFFLLFRWSKVNEKKMKYCECFINLLSFYLWENFTYPWSSLCCIASVDGYIGWLFVENL